MQPLPVRVGLWAMEMKGYFTFPKAPRLEFHHKMLLYHIQDTCWRGLTHLQRWLIGKNGKRESKESVLLACLDDDNDDKIQVLVVSITSRYLVPVVLGRCPWCNGYRCRKWTQWHEFKSWTRLIAFHKALIPLGKVWIQLFSLQLWVNSRTD